MTTTRRLLDEQRALVTGASSGIGRAVALAFGEAGAAVLVNFLAREDAAMEVVSEIEQVGGTAIAVRGDVGKPDDCIALFEAARRARTSAASTSSSRTPGFSATRRLAT